MVRAFHGTRNLNSILDDGSLFCYSLANEHSEDKEEMREKLEQINRRAYLRTTKQMAELGKAHNLAVNVGYPVETDEEWADLAKGAGLGDWQEYKEMERTYFVWLGDYPTAYRWIGGEGDVLEMEVPEEKIRKSRANGCTLVWDRLDLSHLQAVYTPAVKVVKGWLVDRKIEAEVKELERP